ncbi:hypothetical protein N8837_00955 [Pseudomonadales bacterium]|nr:hypothetical protein [Pseudomonadales bacterium]
MKKMIDGALQKIIMGSAFAALVMLAGCSFHSNQWSALKGLLAPEKVVTQGSWLLSGPGDDFTVYPVQSNDAIIFTDGQGIFLKFDGWHFTEVRGYRARDMELISGKPDIVGFDYKISDPGSVGAESETSPAEMSYASGGENKMVFGVICAPWQRTSISGGELLSQSCLFDNQEAFSNSIWLDQSGNIRAVESVLGPEGVNFRVARQD